MLDNSVDGLFDRLRRALGVETLMEMAEALGVHQSTLSTWRSRNRPDLLLIWEKTRSLGWSMEWLLTGRGPERYEDTGSPVTDASGAIMLGWIPKGAGLPDWSDAEATQEWAGELSTDVAELRRDFDRLGRSVLAVERRVAPPRPAP